MRYSAVCAALRGGAAGRFQYKNYEGRRVYMNGMAVMAAVETPSAMEGVTTALTTGITSIASSATDAIAKVLPCAV